MRRLMAWACALIVILPQSPAFSQVKIRLDAGKSTLLALPDIRQVSIADPGIADVQVTPQKTLVINAKRPGSTTLRVWSQAGRFDYDLSVAADVSALREVLDRTLPSHGIRLETLGNRVILTGRVEKPSQVEMAGKLAQAFTRDVINLLSPDVAPQVQVDVNVIELRRGKGHELGVDWGALRVTGSGEALFQKDMMTFAERAAGSTFTFQQFDRLAAQLKLLVNEGSAKVLAKPRLVAVSGGKASFLVGGQIPVPQAQQLGQVTVTWRDYGVKLNVEPVVREDGRISLKVKPEVSSLDFANAIRLNGFTIPSISSRQAETEVMLRPGEGLAIGGLLQSSETSAVEKLPLLGDIPVLGALFRSTQFQRDETELTIFVTPRLVIPSATDSAPQEAAR